jgi:uncharacterized membrane protein YhaH (DUF805 family)
MDWKKLFLDANGRIGQKDFWIGFVILFVIGIILQMIPKIGQIAGILLLYPWVCLYSKRLHDMGKTGWLQLIPIAVFCVAMILAFITGGAAMLTGAAGGNPAAAMAGMGMAGLIFGLAFLVWIGFLLWVGLSKGEPGENQYGPAPTPLVGGATPA